MDVSSDLCGSMGSKTVMAWLLAALCVCAPAASAQEVAISLEQLVDSGRLAPGDVVYVTNTLGRRVRGSVGDVSSSALMVELAGLPMFGGMTFGRWRSG